VARNNIQYGRGAVKRGLLIAPPFYRLMGSHYNGLHLGLGYIAAVLEERGYNIKVYNADYRNSPDYSNQRQLFESFSTYKGMLDDLSHPIWSEIKDRIASFAPDIIGITMLTANYKAAKNIAQISKALDPGLKIVVGGVHPTLDPEGTMAEDEFDFAIRREGEFPFLELVEGRAFEDIDGLSWKKEGKVIHNKERPYINNLDILPFPQRDSFMNSTDYLDVGYVITGRGCPFACTYCASPQIWQRKVRYRSIPNIMEELRHLKVRFNPPLIHFVDDTFNLDNRFTKEICRRIIDEGLKLNWICEARADYLDKELVSLMVEAGCVRIKLGIESGSDRILKMINKGFTTQMVRRGVGIIKECQLPLTVYLMVGIPGETNEDLRRTIELAKELDADYYSLSVLAPYYGTQIWKELEESGKRMNNEHWEYFYHQSRELIVNSKLDPAIVDEFLALNEREGKGKRV